jgi:hypothetical protein
VQAYWKPFWIATGAGCALGLLWWGPTGALALALPSSYVGLLLTALAGRSRLRRLAHERDAAEQRSGQGADRKSVILEEIRAWERSGAISPSLAALLRARQGAAPVPGALQPAAAAAGPRAAAAVQEMAVVHELAGAAHGAGSRGPASAAQTAIEWPAEELEPAPALAPLQAEPGETLAAQAAAASELFTGMPLAKPIEAGPAPAVKAGPAVGEAPAPPEPPPARAEEPPPARAEEPPPALAEEPPPALAAEPPLALAGAELPSRAARVLEHHSSWHRLLRPLLYENFVLFVGAFLILAGSVFGIVDNWNRAGQWRPVLVVGAMALYTHVFFLLGYLLTRRPQLASIGLSLLSIPVLLLPFLYLGVGLLSDGFVGLWLLAMVLLGAADLFCLLLVGGLQHRPSSRRFAGAFLALCLFQAVAGMLGRATGAGGPLLGAAVFVALYFGALRPFAVRHLPGILVESSRAAAFTLGSLVFAFATVVGHLHFLRASAAEPVPPGAYGPLLVLLGWLALDVHRALAEHIERRRHHELWRALALALTAAGVVLAVGSALSGQGPAAAIPLATGLGTLLLVRAHLAEPRPLHLWGALLLSLAAYNSSPALFAELARALLAGVASAAGYKEQPLPLAYYSLTFLPYLLALGGLASWLDRRGKSPWALLGWASAIAGAALAVSLSYPADRRPALAASVIYGALALAVHARWKLRAYLLAALAALPLATDLALVLAGAGGAARIAALALGAAALCSAGMRWRRRTAGQASLEVGLAAAAAAGLAGAAAWLWTGAGAGAAAGLAGAALGLALGAAASGSRLLAGAAAAWLLALSAASAEALYGPSALPGGVALGGLLLVGLWHAARRGLGEEPREAAAPFLGLAAWPLPAASDRHLYSAPLSGAAAGALLLAAWLLGLQGPEPQAAAAAGMVALLGLALLGPWPSLLPGWIAAGAQLFAAACLLPWPPASGFMHGAGGLAVLWWIASEAALERTDGGNAALERFGRSFALAAGLLALGTLALWAAWTQLHLLGVSAARHQHIAHSITLALATLGLLLAASRVPCRTYAYAACVALGLLSAELLDLLGPRAWSEPGLGLVLAGVVLLGLGHGADRVRKKQDEPFTWLPWPPGAGRGREDGRGLRLAVLLADPALRLAAAAAMLGALVHGADARLWSWPLFVLPGLTLLLVAARRPRQPIAMAGWFWLAMGAYQALFSHWRGDARFFLALSAIAAGLTGAALLFHTGVWPRPAQARWTRGTYGPPARWVAVGALMLGLLICFESPVFTLPVPGWRQLDFVPAALLAAISLLLHARMSGAALYSLASAVAALWACALGLLAALSLLWPPAAPWDPVALDEPAISAAMAAEMLCFVLAALFLLLLAHARAAPWTLGLATGRDELPRTRQSWSLVALVAGLCAVLGQWSWSVLTLDPDAAGGMLGPAPGALDAAADLGRRVWLVWLAAALLSVAALQAAGRRLTTAAAVPGLAAASVTAVVAACALAAWPLAWTALALVGAAALAADLAGPRSWLWPGGGWAVRAAGGSRWAVPLGEASCALVLLWGLALGGGDPRTLATPGGIGVLGLALLAAGVRRRWPLLVPASAAALYGAACGTLAGYGLSYPSGRPEPAILPFFGLVALLMAELALLLRKGGGERPAAAEPLAEPGGRAGRLRALLAASRSELAWSAGALQALAVLCAALSAALLGARANGLEAAVTALVLVGLAAGWMRRASTRQSSAGAHLGLGAALLGLLYLRWCSPWLGFVSPAQDTVLWIVVGFVLLGLWRLRVGGSALQRPLALWTVLCPLALLPWLAHVEPGQLASGLVAAGILYIAAAHETGGRRLAYLAAAVLNAGLLLLFGELSLEHLSFYALPVGATLLALVQLERDRLGREARFHLQNVGVAVICGSAAYETFDAGGLGSFALLLGLCLAGVMGGAMLRIRSFVFCASGILAATVVGQMVRASLEMALPAWMLLTTLGMAIVGLTIFLSWKRQQVLAWYRLALEDFTRWD